MHLTSHVTIIRIRWFKMPLYGAGCMQSTEVASIAETMAAGMLWQVGVFVR
jgi:hypothetical protein